MDPGLMVNVVVPPVKVVTGIEMCPLNLYELLVRVGRAASLALNCI
jgi:hypothetical protein